MLKRDAVHGAAAFAHFPGSDDVTRFPISPLNEVVWLQL